MGPEPAADDRRGVGRVLEVGAVPGAGDEGHRGVRPDRAGQPSGEGGELGVVDSCQHEDGNVDRGETVPQRLLGAGAGEAQARGETRSRVGQPLLAGRGRRQADRRTVAGPATRRGTPRRRPARCGRPAPGRRRAGPPARTRRRCRPWLRSAPGARPGRAGPGPDGAPGVRPSSSRRRWRGRRCRRAASPRWRGRPSTPPEPPWPGASTSTSSWSRARSSANRPQQRPVWVKPWTSTRRSAVPSARTCSGPTTAAWSGPAVESVTSRSVGPPSAPARRLPPWPNRHPSAPTCRSPMSAT